MARAKANISVKNFAGGLNTDTSELNTPENTTTDEDNCDLSRKGFRLRRLGLEPEGDVANSPTVLTDEEAETQYTKTYEWSAVANNNDLDFLVVQVGDELFFYDKSFDPLEGGLKPFIVNMNLFRAPSVPTQGAEFHGIQVASGKGALFVVGEKIEPFFIEYDPGTDTITTTEITIRIRDLELQDTTTDFEARPTTLTAALRYDLYNQGWGYAEVAGNDSVRYQQTVQQHQIAVEYYFFATDHYPPRTKPWWVGKRSAIDPGESGFEVFDPSGVYDPIGAGNTVAALGHFIVEAYRKDRAAVSGITSLPIDIDETRPTAVEFYSGRVFYGHKDTVYFSQLITDDLSIVGDCYQAADPTAEEISDLIATDGGVITISTSGEIIQMRAKNNSLICFYNNGIWIIGGITPGDGFSATQFSVKKMTGIGAISPRNIVEVEGQPAWWSDEGIYILADGGGAGDAFEVKSITDTKIQNFYDEIAPLAKEFATGAYDSIQKRIIWLFSSSTTLNNLTGRFYYNRLLNYDVLKQAWFPWTITDSSEGSKLLDVFNVATHTTSSSTEFVTDGGVIVTDGGIPVTVRSATFTDSGTVTRDTKYLIFGETLS